MSTPDSYSLHEVLAEWQSLTVDESQAIGLSQWGRLQTLQEKKRRLQDLINQHPSQSSTVPADNVAALAEYKPQVETILQLEHANADLLGQRMAEVRQARNELKQSGQNIKRIQKAYTLARSPVWQKYS